MSEDNVKAPAEAPADDIAELAEYFDQHFSNDIEEEVC